MSIPCQEAETRKLTAPPDLVGYRWVGRGSDLEALCTRWRQQEVVALDTEFVRERTFYPALGLVQLAAGDEIALIDPQEIEDPQPLVDLLRDAKVTKVLHACSEDLETFRHTWGCLPEPLVDTQIAAAMVGLDWSMGYGRLVASLCGVDLPKGHTRTDWLKRPLSDAQKHYAALDVVYLLPIWSHLQTRLHELGRVHWLTEDCAALIDLANQDLDPNEAYLQIGRSRILDPRRLAVLQAVARWREEQARERDLPRNFVLREQAVAEIAQRPPRTLEELRRVKAVGQQEIRRDGETILDLVRHAESMPGDQLPEPIGRPVDLAPHTDTVKKLRNKVDEIADELGVPSVLLSNKRTIEELVRRSLESRDPALPSALRGWRRTAAGDILTGVLGPA